MSTLLEFSTVDAVHAHLSALSPTALAILTFHAPWAKPCQQMRTLLAALAGTVHAEDPPRASFLWVDAEALPDLAEEYDIRSVPCMVLLREGKTVDKVYGCNADTVKPAVEKALAARDKAVSQAANGLPPKLEVNPRKLEPRAGAPHNAVAAAASVLPAAESKTAETNGGAAAAPVRDLSAYAPTPADPATAPQMTAAATSSDEEDLNKRLAELVKAAPVMLFMKGTPSAPQCGFSRTIVSMLRENSVKYGFFNILADEDVRQGLKKWADWPTYPQLWMGGDLVGGLDIVKEELESNPDYFKPYAVGAGQGGMAAPEAQRQPEVPASG